MSFSVMTRDPDGNEIEVAGPYKSGSWARKKAREQQPERRDQVFFVVNHERDWRKRERDRFAKGHYTPLPFSDDPKYQKDYPDHFAHFSKKNPLNVAYTPDNDYGSRDRKLSRSFARYMGDFAPHIKNRDKLVADHTKAVTLKLVKFTEKPEEGEWVYKHGPASCMNGQRWNSKVHPAQIYAGGTLRLAYVLRPDGKRASARAVVDIEKKTYCTAYGEVNGRPFYQLLNDLGFNNASWKGATFPLIVQQQYGKRYDCFVFPICDGAGRFRIEGNMVRVYGTNEKNTFGNMAGNGLCRLPKPIKEGIEGVRYL